MNRLDDMCVKPCHCDHLLSHDTVVVDYQGKDWDLDLDRIVGQNDMVVLLLRWTYMKGLVPLEYQRANVRSMSDGTTNQGLNGLEKSCCFYYFSLFLGLITSCCSGKWALTHCNPPRPLPLKNLFGEDQRPDLKDGRNWAQYGHSSDDYLIGWGCSIYCWPSLLHYQFKGDVKGPILFEKRCNRLARVVYLLWGEGTVTGLQ